MLAHFIAKGKSFFGIEAQRVCGFRRCVDHWPRYMGAGRNSSIIPSSVIAAQHHWANIIVVHHQRCCRPRAGAASDKPSVVPDR
jgi:hypothetical protein